MGQELNQWTAEKLPAVTPIFPLIGVLLLPGGRLPLNIFEPRYLEMTQDAMASHRIIGMIQPADPHSRDFESDIYHTGCAGLVSEFEETADNRILVTLTGVCRFEVANELPREGLLYRRVAARYQSYACDLIQENAIALDRDRLISALRKFFAARGIDADWSAIDEMCNEDLMTSFAMACPFGPSEKQALLECRETKERSAMFQALLEMAAHERDGMEGAGAPQ
ncbi:MAG: LON peptidase substrate-binding domain-containing protein [Alphaproteobacteria bacterium]|nr:LON peptidase substrate-binding domain-containing protein [Alphaproteobacteria bacterium]